MESQQIKYFLCKTMLLLLDQTDSTRSVSLILYSPYMIIHNYTVLYPYILHPSILTINIIGGISLVNVLTSSSVNGPPYLSLPMSILEETLFLPSR